MTRFLDRHRIDVPTVVAGIGCGALLFTLASLFVSRGHPRASPEPVAESPGPDVELVEPGRVDAKLRAQEGHIVELRNRVQALEKAMGDWQR